MRGRLSPPLETFPRRLRLADLALRQSGRRQPHLLGTVAGVARDCGEACITSSRTPNPAVP